uniref:tetratricopeptide repeat protein n=1 Tax=Desulfosarcina sp. TaxID=2027861 RepID=UPI003562F6C8
MNQTHAWITYGAGMVYIKKKRYEAGSDKFRELLAAHPQYGDAIAQLGVIERNQGRRDNAKRYIEKTLSQDPENKIANYQFGLFHLENREYVDAADHFSRVLKADPSHTCAMIQLAIVAGRNGDFKKAETLVNDAYDKDDKLTDAFAKLGWIKAEKQDWAGALEIMDKDSCDGRISPAWKVNLAQLYGRNGEWDRAIELIEDAYGYNLYLKDAYSKLGWIKTEDQD